MDNIGKTVIIFSLLGICILYGISLSSFAKPPSVPLEEVEAHEGEIVSVKGFIIDLRTTEYGNLLVKIKNGKKELQIFVQSPNEKQDHKQNLNYGDEIEVTGKVQLYGRGGYEIVASSVSAIKKLEYGEDNISFVSQIAKHPEEYEGRKISVVGHVQKSYKNIFYLGDEKGDYHMRVMVMANDISISELREDDKIIAKGLFLYAPENMRYELNLISLRYCKCETEGKGE